MSKKRHVWLVLVVLVLIGAALFSLLSRRAAAVLHLPNSTAGIHDITLSKKTPIGETGEAFVQNYTLTPDREAELVQEAYHWLASVRFRDLRSSTTEFGSGLLGGGILALGGAVAQGGQHAHGLRGLLPAAQGNGVQPCMQLRSAGFSKRRG